VRREKGFALLVAVLISSVVLAVGLSMLNITLKQYIFSGIGRESEIAFYAADAGMECALYWDASSQGGIFDLGVGGATNFACMGQTQTAPAGGTSGDSKEFQYDWQTSGQAVCTKISITKYLGPDSAPNQTCDTGAVCSQLESRGYNRPCSQLNSPRVVERALRANY
jgi:hypothetical protein